MRQSFEVQQAPPSARREISLCASRPLSDWIGIFDRRSEAGSKSRLAPFDPAKPSGTQNARTTGGAKCGSDGVAMDAKCGERRTATNGCPTQRGAQPHRQVHDEQG